MSDLPRVERTGDAGRFSRPGRARLFARKLSVWGFVLLLGTQALSLSAWAQAAPAPGEDARLRQLRIENDGASFVLRIPVDRPLVHSSLDDPPRIVLDLSATTSYLPKAPGLYQVRLDRGPVAALRTSQYRYSAWEHITRITLELAEAAPYEVVRSAGAIEIRVPDPVARSPRALVIGSSGLSPADSREEPDGSPTGGPTAAPAGEDAFSAPEVKALLPAAAPDDASAGPEREGEKTDEPSAPQTDELSPPQTDELSPPKTDEPRSPEMGELSSPDPGQPFAPEPTASTEEASTSTEHARDPANAAPAAGSGESGLLPAFRTLRQALAAAVGSRNVQPLDQARPDEPLGTAGDSGIARRTTERIEEEPAEGAPTEEAGRSAGDTGRDAARGTGAAAAADPSEAAEAGREAARGQGSAPPNAPREAAAARLLAQANAELLRGDRDGARRAAERAHRFYALTAAGGQATILLRELLVLEGKEVEADLLGSQEARPDTTLLPPAVFRQLVGAYQQRSQLTEVDRLLRDWGPSYGPEPSFGSLHLGLGEALLRAGRTDLARTHLEQVPTGGASEARAVMLLARAADRAGDKRKALELYQRLSILPAGPLATRGLVRMADLQFQLGDIAEAVVNYESFLAGEPLADEEPWVVYQLGNCSLLNGDPGQARVRYETVIGRWPQSYWAGFARTQLEEIKWRDHLHSRSGPSNPETGR